MFRHFLYSTGLLAAIVLPLGSQAISSGLPASVDSLLIEASLPTGDTTNLSGAEGEDGTGDHTGPAAAAPNPTDSAEVPSNAGVTSVSVPGEIRPIMEAAAAAHSLPLDFLARIIEKESGFNPRAVSPVGAQGIAQFMPATAKERGLEDPFDPAQALPECAEFLSELHARFGNLGLAAAAYNAGPGRVSSWLKGEASLPRETQDYVLKVTGLPATEWAGSKFAASEAKLAELSAPKASEAGDTPPKKPIPKTTEEAKQAKPIKLAKLKKNWRVRIAGHHSREKAVAAKTEIVKKHASALSGHAPEVIKGKQPGRGKADFYKVAVAVDTREAADKLCSRLKAAGRSCTTERI